MKGPRGGKAGKTVPGEFYAGYRAGETPRRALVDGRWAGVAAVLSRRRVLDAGTGGIRDLFRCRLVDGRVVEVASGSPPSPAARAAAEMDGRPSKG